MSQKYSTRLWTATKGIATGWRFIPKALRELRVSGYDFLHDVLALIGTIILPLFIFLTPLFLYMAERDDKRREKARTERLKAYVSGLQKADNEDEWGAPGC